MSLETMLNLTHLCHYELVRQVRVSMGAKLQSIGITKSQRLLSSPVVLPSRQK